MFKVKHYKYRTQGQKKPLYGVGINDADYPITYKDEEGVLHKCPYYSVWASMVERCFSKRFQEKRPTYKGCTLAKEWQVFSNFKTWMESQPWQGKVLDKDLLSKHQKHYSPDTCVFISKELNNLLTLRSRYRGQFPLGVSQTTINGQTYFIASCSFYGKQKRLGYFKTQKEAADAYKEAKTAYIKKLAKKEQDPKILGALFKLL